MVIHSSLPAAAPQISTPTPARPAPAPAGDSTQTLAALDMSQAPQIGSADEAQQTVDFAARNILDNTNLSLLAHGNLSSETVFALLKP